MHGATKSVKNKQLCLIFKAKSKIVFDRVVMYLYNLVDYLGKILVLIIILVKLHLYIKHDVRLL